MNTTFVYLLITLMTLGISTCMYLFLHYKTKIRKIFILTDNVVVGVFSGLIVFLLFRAFSFDMILVFQVWLSLIVISGCLVVVSGFALTMIRFWRTPSRQISAVKGEVVSPADGNVIYIRKFESGEIPVSIKKGLTAKLSEIAASGLIETPGWIIGINMTPFDVHKNCVPVTGQIILNKHISGQFLSLKNPDALKMNERNSLIIRTEENELFGVVQTASRLVRRIDTYVSEGEFVQQGKWFGMIRFGSQVDLILPENYSIQISVGDQVFARKTIVATK